MEVDHIVHQAEEQHGADSPWNSIWKLQEVVYRARTPQRILWLMLGLDDWINAGKLPMNELNVTAIKSQSKTSVSDIILHQKRMRDYLLGEWLDGVYGKSFPSYVKAMLSHICCIYNNMDTYMDACMSMCI